MCIANNYVDSIKEKISDIKLILKNYKQDVTNLHEQLSNVDLQLTDLDHAILHRKKLKIPAHQLMKMVLKISELQQERLKVKNDIELLESIKPFIKSLNEMHVPTRVTQGIDKMENVQSNRKYRERTDVLKQFNISFSQE